MSEVSDKQESQFPVEQSQTPRRAKKFALLQKEMAIPALKQAIVMLRPDIQWKNPVMFVVEVGAILTLLYIIRALWGRAISDVPVSYFIAVDVWLFLTVLFANFATALAEARGKAQAQSLRRARHDTTAYRLIDAGKIGKIEEVSSAVLQPGDKVDRKSVV
jgi:K+-transporting ATPase ATPase B chain